MYYEPIEINKKERYIETKTKMPFLVEVQEYDDSKKVYIHKKYIGSNFSTREEAAVYLANYRPMCAKVSFENGWKVVCTEKEIEVHQTASQSAALSNDLIQVPPKKIKKQKRYVVRETYLQKS
jgi:hypothetical protein